MKRSAVYAGSFDPLTNGHLDVIRRVLPLFDKLYIVVATHPLKGPLFSVEERLDLIKASLKNEVKKGQVEIHSWSDLLVHFCQKVNSKILIRGIRSLSDFEVEFQMSTMNRHLNSKVETLHIMTDEKYFFVSSTLIKEVARYGGSLKGLVPNNVALAIKKKIPEVKRK